LPAGTYTLTIAGKGETASATGDLNVNVDMTITGAGPSNTIIDGGAIDRVLLIRNGVTLTLSGVTIRNGNPGATADGGGIWSNGGRLVFGNAVLSGNSARNGGGMYSGSWDSTFTDVTISGNTASAAGGGLYNLSGTATITRVTLSGNTAATNGGGAYDNGSNGLLMTNVTVNGNTAASGGGIHDNGSSGLVLTNVTVAGNGATTGGNVRIGTGAGNAKIKNTIIANPSTGVNCDGAITSLGNNLESANTCSFALASDKRNTSPGLGVLQGNGGPTLTMALQTGSAAIDAGTNTGCPATDQRGVARPFGSFCDVGAFEYTGSPPSVVLTNSVSPGGAQPPGTDLTYSVQFSNGGGSLATGLVIVDALRPYVDFKLGSPTSNLGTTGLTVAIAYSNNGGSTFTYTPASAGGGAPAGYDRNVTHIRWSFTGSLSPTAPSNAGSVGFTARIW
jgi:hypothetical protein